VGQRRPVCVCWGWGVVGLGALCCQKGSRQQAAAHSKRESTRPSMPQQDALLSALWHSADSPGRQAAAQALNCDVGGRSLSNPAMSYA